MRKKKSFRIPSIFLLGAAAAILTTSSWAIQERVLYNFDGNDGASPTGTLIFDDAGNLYGTTINGGAYGDGTVFELVPTAAGGWTETVLHSFNANGTDGINPHAGLVFDVLGNLYSTTCGGGLYGYGTVFELMPAGDGQWTEKILHNFNNNDGSCSYAPLIFDSVGNLYGTAYAGGPGGGGTVFELIPAAEGGWTEKIVHAFNFNEEAGGYPEGGLVFDSMGDLYGAASDSADGLIFELIPTAQSGQWTYKVAYRFNGKNGSGPHSAPIFDAKGNLYDTTYVGGADNDGMVFELTLTEEGEWVETGLHSFDGNDGIFCYAGVVFDKVGNLYGTVVEGGTYNDGTVFVLTPTGNGAWTRHVLHDFNGADGAYPWANLILDDSGNLYSTTESGGNQGYGTVFEITH